MSGNGAIRRFSTELRGELLMPDDLKFDVRVLREEGEPPRYYRLIALALAPLAAGSLDDARLAIERELASEGFRLGWKRGCGPAGDAEAPCFICGAAVDHSTRYPEHLCGACVHESVDERGRLVSFANTDLMGTGFQSIVVGTDERGADHVCFVRGRKCWADEAYFGGVVVVPYERR